MKYEVWKQTHYMTRSLQDHIISFSWEYMKSTANITCHKTSI